MGNSSTPSLIERFKNALNAAVSAFSDPNQYGQSSRTTYDNAYQSSFRVDGARRKLEKAYGVLEDAMEGICRSLIVEEPIKIPFLPSNIYAAPEKPFTFDPNSDVGKNIIKVAEIEYDFATARFGLACARDGVTIDPVTSKILDLTLEAGERQEMVAMAEETLERVRLQREEFYAHDQNPQDPSAPEA